MQTSALGRRVVAALFSSLFCGLPSVARATPGPDDARPSPARAAVIPRELPGQMPVAARFADTLVSDAFWEVSTRGALQPRAGLGHILAEERGPGPALVPAQIDRGFVETGVNADIIPIDVDTVTRGAVMPLRGDEPGAWPGDGVGADDPATR